MLRSLRVATSDLPAALLFCRDALSLPHLAAPPAGAATAQRPGTFCCELALRAHDTAAAATAAAPGLLRYPFLTYGVSNLRTSARHAARHGGVALPPGSSGSGGGGAASAAAATEAAFALPGATAGVRLLHLFRRNPAVSVTLGLAEPARGAALLGAALGLRVLGGAEAALAAPRAGRASIVLAAPGAQPHNTTSLVLEALEGGSADGSALEESAVLTLATADPAGALAACRAASLPTSTPSASGSFVALLLDGGYSLHCVPL
jgi:hypothetical protein